MFATALAPSPFNLIGLLPGLATLALNSRRLHDIGVSAWWQLPLILARMPMGILKAANIDASGWALFLLLADLVFTVALIAWPGQPHENAFGPPPAGKPAEPAEDVFT